MKHVWRACFVVAGVAILIGGPMHPGGTMVQMLEHPDWTASHLWQLAGYGALAVGLVLVRRRIQPTGRVDLWSKLAVIGAVLQTIELAFHTSASVDAENLAAGLPTPVLTTHLVMTVLFYPIFSATIIGFIVAAAFRGTFGTRWIAWLGVLGALGHGLAAVLVAGLDVTGARVLFPTVMLLALWLILVAFLPVRLAETALAAASSDS